MYRREPAARGAPFLRVAGHVERAVRAEPFVLADARQSLSAEVADQQDVGIDALRRCLVPVPVGREALAGVRRIRRGFVPADADHGLVGCAFRIGTQLPPGRPGPAGGISELGDGVFPGDRATVLHERLRPVRPVAVAARIDERLELAVRHLVAVYPETCQWCGRVRCVDGAINVDHPRGRLARSSERHHPHTAASGQLARVVAGLGQPPSPVAERHHRAFQRRRPERQPLAGRIEIGPGRHVNARRRRLERGRVHHIVGQPRELRIVGDDVLHLRQKAVRGVGLIACDERFDLRHRHLARPAGARRAEVEPCGCAGRQHGDDDERRR